MIKPAQHIYQAVPYHAGKPISALARETGIAVKNIVKLASNENPLGMSTKAMNAYIDASAALSRYPDPDGYDLRAALSESLHLDQDHFILGSGSNEILDMAASTFLNSNSACVYSQYAFIVYAQATQRIGAKHVVVPALGLGHDLDSMIASCDADVRLLYVANPNNPTGTYISPNAVEKFLERVPKHVVVVLDEAYNEYLPIEMRFDSTVWVRKFPNLLVSRTFSKAYGMAGLRIGYGIAQPALINWMNRVRPAFNVTTAAQYAAIAALGDQDFLDKSFEVNRAGMRQLQTGLDRLQVKWHPSHANFLLAYFENASQVNASLQQIGIIVRPVAGYGLTSHLRISVGLEKENARLLGALEEILGR
jgi:histidinol-phosphate aminotransferase